nr:DUF6127 family protein [Sagittula salina]
MAIRQPHPSRQRPAGTGAAFCQAAEKGAKRALADFGLDGEEAALDIRDLRSLLDCVRLVRRPPCKPPSA